MARPRLGEGVTERLHLKITDDEIKAIDDWRFANRVESRSEAIRRLCQMALTIDREADQLIRSAHSSMTESADYVEAIELAAKKAKSNPSNVASVEDLDALHKMHMDLSREVIRALISALLMRRHAEFRDAVTAQIAAAEDDSEIWNLLDEFIEREPKS